MLRETLGGDSQNAEAAKRPSRLWPLISLSLIIGACCAAFLANRVGPRQYGNYEYNPFIHAVIVLDLDALFISLFILTMGEFRRIWLLLSIAAFLSTARHGLSWAMASFFFAAGCT